MKKFFTVVFLFLALPLLTVSCSKKKSPLQQAPPQKFEELTLYAGETKEIVIPEVVVLIVVDNSDSMMGHQKTFQRNARSLAEKFIKNTTANFKVGVVPVYDRKYLNDTKIYNGVGIRTMNPLGELVALRNKDGSLVNSNVPYVTRETPNAAEVLESTVVIGTQWGPEAEELFSPVLEIVENEKLNTEKNSGFYNPDAELVIIFMTDAEDAMAGVSAGEFYRKLKRLRNDENGDRIHIAAAIPDISMKSKDCRLDGRGPIDKIPALIEMSRGKVVNLCASDFGSQLASLGENIASKIATIAIRLNFLPDMNYKLTYGLPETEENKRQVLPKEGPGSYVYLPGSKEESRFNEFLLPPDLKVNPIPGGKFYISAIPLHLSNGNTGRLNSL